MSVLAWSEARLSEHGGGNRGLTAPKATDSIVCMRPSSTEPITPFWYTSDPPTSVQNLMCLIPTDTNWVSESGLNSTTKIRSVCPLLLVTLVPDGKVKGQFTYYCLHVLGLSSCIHILMFIFCVQIYVIYRSRLCCWVCFWVFLPHSGQKKHTAALCRNSFQGAICDANMIDIFWCC